MSTSATWSAIERLRWRIADPALARERDREPRLGHRVHRGGDDRDLERDRPRQPRRGAHVVRQHGRLGGHEQHVVEGEPFLAELRSHSNLSSLPRSSSRLCGCSQRRPIVPTASDGLAGSEPPHARGSRRRPRGGRRRAARSGRRRPRASRPRRRATASRSASSAVLPASWAARNCASSTSPAPTTDTASSAGATAR